MIEDDGAVGGSNLLEEKGEKERLLMKGEEKVLGL